LLVLLLLDKLHSLLKGAIVGSHQVLKCAKKLDKHLTIACAHGEYYYANHYRSHTFSHETLTIMYDKMDHAKITSLVFSHKNKDFDSLTKLHVSITGMIAHDHRDVCYTHYSLDLFSQDSNCTIGSMAKLLRDLELPLEPSSWEMFVGSQSSLLFAVVLKGAEMCKASLPPPPMTLVLATPLPPILHMQMDNVTGNNKNRYVFCFWSLLVANKIFLEVFVNFMIVGHTHDNINALFGRWSMLLKKENFSTIPALMKSFMKSFMNVESILTTPHLIEEVPNFKDFMTSKFNDGDKILVGHTRLQ